MHVISFVTALRTPRSHSMIYFQDRGVLNREGALFAMFAWKGGLNREEVYLRGGFNKAFTVPNIKLA